MKVKCMFSDRSAVSLDLEGHNLFLGREPNFNNRSLYGTVSEGSLLLTTKEARDLGEQLLIAAEQAEEMKMTRIIHDEMKNEAEAEWNEIRKY